MPFIDNYTGTDEDFQIRIRPRIIDSGVLIGGHPYLNNWATLHAYSVADGSLLWSRNGSEDEDGRVLQYNPLLAHGGKLLVKVDCMTHQTIDYNTIGVTDADATGGSGWRLLDWDPIACTNQIFPVTSSYYEVIDILTGDSLAQRDLDSGYTEHELAQPSGSFSVEDSDDIDAYPRPATHSATSIGVYLDTGYIYSASGDYWAGRSHVHTSIGVYGDAFYTYHDWYDDTPPYDVHYQWVRWPMSLIAARSAIPPKHSIDNVCVSTDGEVIVFAPHRTRVTGDGDEDAHSGVIVAGALTDVPWGGTYAFDASQYCVGLDWDLQELWEKDVGKVDEIGQIMAVGEDVLLRYLDLNGEDPIYRYVRLNPEDGETVDDYELSLASGAATASHHITTQTRLVQIDQAGATVINYTEPE